MPKNRGELEHKVRVLEQELQILKNQIQATLLDIQEQLLTNHYPSLRADDAGYVPPPVAAQPNPPVEAAVQPAQAAPQDYDAYHDTQDTPLPGSIVRTIALDESNGDHPPEAQPEPEPLPAPDALAPDMGWDGQDQPPPQAGAAPNWEAFTRLSEWACSSAERMGASRTRKLIAMYVDSGYFDAADEDALLQLVSLYDDDGSIDRQRLDEMREAGSHGSDDSSSGGDMRQSVIHRLIEAMQTMDA